MDLDLNFSVAPASGPSKPKPSTSSSNRKGGWVQRTNTKSKQRRLSSKQNPVPPRAPSPTRTETAKSSQPKASRSQQAAQSQSSLSAPTNNSQIKEKSRQVATGHATSDPSHSETPPPPKGKSIISSLFTSIPEWPALATRTATTTRHSPSNAPSQRSFASLHIYPELVSCLKSSKFNHLERPTPIQHAAVPLLHQAQPGSDYIMQAQTGSGKTLAYLLPIVQDLLRLGERLTAQGHPPHRQLGTMAIVLVPTRELANQVYQVALNLLSMASNKMEEEEDDDDEKHQAEAKKGRPHTWMTPGLLSGGMSRQHEKARLRKGVPLLIATPGRLIDHLETTTSFHIAGEQRRVKRQPVTGKQRKGEDDFDVEDQPFEPNADAAESSEEEFADHSRSYKPRKRFGDASAAPPPTTVETPQDPQLSLRWLVLDEADRLVDMGFEPQIRNVLSKLQERKSKIQQRASILQEARRTILCSATMPSNVKKLAGQVLESPIMLRGDPAAEAENAIQHKAPEQLDQSYAVIPPKLRLVALVALLRQICVNVPKNDTGSAKAVVFMSCIDAVEFHWKALGSMHMGHSEPDEAPTPSSTSTTKEKLVQRCPVLASVPVYRLHGDLDLSTRLGSLKGFTSSTEGGILLCTSLAARGLDVPFVNSVIQYDLPTEGGLTEYIHRVGRTARAGQEGSSWAFLLPSEVGWVEWAKAETGARLQETGVQDLLKDGFGGKGKEFESRATDVQLAVERWVEAKPTHADLARNAFTSHVRAYATHPGNEKHIFHRRNLHLGHLAKAFGLREAPAGLGKISGAHKKDKASQISLDGPGQRKKRKKAGMSNEDGSDLSSGDDNSHEREEERPSRPKLPRTGRGAEGRGLKPAKASTASEFNIGSTADLEALVKRR